MKHNVDVVRIRENEIELNGWAIGKTPETEITYRVEDGARRPMDFRFVRTRRDDVSQIYYKKMVDRDLGFDRDLRLNGNLRFGRDLGSCRDLRRGGFSRIGRACGDVPRHHWQRQLSRQ